MAVARARACPCVLLQHIHTLKSLFLVSTHCTQLEVA